MNRRMGFTVVEIMVVVVIAGLIVLLGMPKVRQGMIRTNVRGARTTVVNMLARARIVSTQTGRKTWVQLGGNKAYVQARPRRTAGAAACQCDTIGAVEDLNAKYGVTLTLTGPDSIAFDPQGLGAMLGASTKTITVTKSSHYNTITVDGLGRVTQ